MDLIEGSETSAIINQTPGNYPKESLLYTCILLAYFKFRCMWHSLIADLLAVSVCVNWRFSCYEILFLIKSSYMCRWKLFNFHSFVCGCNMFVECKTAPV